MTTITRSVTSRHEIKSVSVPSVHGVNHPHRTSDPIKSTIKEIALSLLDQSLKEMNCGPAQTAPAPSIDRTELRKTCTFRKAEQISRMTHQITQSVGATGGAYKREGRSQPELLTRATAKICPQQGHKLIKCINVRMHQRGREGRCRRRREK